MSYYEFSIQIYTDNEEEAKEIFNSIEEIPNKLAKSVLYEISRRVVK